ncbi:MAG: hypothetical protein GQ574_23085 [Crocinitomix sp.]|nr:hypothetical protein [Crocinitomix sp.]
MERSITHLMINSIRIEENVLLVGATDNERWRWDIEDGMSGVHAKTIVYVTLTKSGKTNDGRDCFSEEAGFHASPR